MRVALACLSLAALSAAAGCLDPDERRPGLALRGEQVAEFPSDWSFSDAHREIAIQVRTPYWIPHSVTIWCAAQDGALYVGARDPESKRWPGWVDRDPRVRLGIGGRIYEAQLVPVDDTEQVARVRGAYARKYDLPETPAADAPPIRYWAVAPRD